MVYIFLTFLVLINDICNVFREEAVPSRVKKKKCSYKIFLLKHIVRFGMWRNFSKLSKKTFTKKPRGVKAHAYRMLLSSKTLSYDFLKLYVRQLCLLWRSPPWTELYFLQAIARCPVLIFIIAVLSFINFSIKFS